MAIPSTEHATKYQIGDIVVVHDRMQSDYRYVIRATEGQDFAPGFKPHFTPKEMLTLGVFEGKYLNDCFNEFPEAWFRDAKLSGTSDPTLNFFGIKSRQSLAEWRRKGWIIEPDPRGWFQWYCRYYLGRRLAHIDEAQIKRWRAFSRHAAQIRRHCMPGDIFCRRRQRQALLQWAYDPFI